MTIEKTLNGSELTVCLTGRLDKTLEYLSSAGLRVLLAAQKVMNKQGAMVIRNVNETIADIFEVTGFSEILTVE